MNREITCVLDAYGFTKHIIITRKQLGDIITCRVFSPIVPAYNKSSSVDELNFVDVKFYIMDYDEKHRIAYYKCYDR